MTNPTLDAIRQFLDKWNQGVRPPILATKDKVVIPDMAADLDAIVKPLLDRLAGSQNACNDNAKRMGLLIEQLNEAKDRLAAVEGEACSMAARYDLGHGIAGHCDIRNAPCPRSCLLKWQSHFNSSQASREIDAEIARADYQKITDLQEKLAVVERVVAGFITYIDSITGKNYEPANELAVLYKSAKQALADAGKG